MRLFFLDSHRPFLRRFGYLSTSWRHLSTRRDLTSTRHTWWLLNIRRRRIFSSFFNNFCFRIGREFLRLLSTSGDSLICRLFRKRFFFFCFFNSPFLAGGWFIFYVILLLTILGFLTLNFFVFFFGFLFAWMFFAFFFFMNFRQLLGRRSFFRFAFVRSRRRRRWTRGRWRFFDIIFGDLQSALYFFRPVVIQIFSGKYPKKYSYKQCLLLRLKMFFFFCIRV